MTSQIFKDPNILNLLEWPLIVNAVQSYSHFDNTAKDRIFIFKNSLELDSVYSKTESFIDLVYNESFLEMTYSLSNFNSDETVKRCIDRLNKSAFLDLKDLNQVAVLIEHYINFRSLYNDLNLIEEDNNSYQNQKRIYFNGIIKEFRSFVDIDGEVDFFKHPLLRNLYTKQTDIEKTIRKTLSLLGSDSAYSDKLQFSGYDIVNDRYVVPIKSDSYQSHLGQIISRSETGHTLFVEPPKIRNLNFDRLNTVIELQKEIENLSIRFSKFLHSQRNHLNSLLDIIFEIDSLNTRARYAHSQNLTRPVIQNKLIMNIKGMFHPLIPNPVRNDIHINENQKGLVISGPNTGGKTASLKTLTLIQLYSRFGLFIPATSAEIFLYDEIFYFGNDGQSLPDGLSSFAAEVANYTDLFSNLGDTNLIIIDEIFNSTSSEEASALAISLFDQLNTISTSHLLVSTHHQMLKSFIHQDDKFLSANVGFNPATSKPTYQLFYGSPGGSQALKIFSLLTENNDINKAIYDNSLKVLDKKMVSYEALLEKISSKEYELNKLIGENKDLNIQLKNQKSSMEGVLKLKLDERVLSTEKDLKKIINQAEEFFKEVKQGKVDSKRGFEKQKNEIKSLIETVKPIAKEPDRLEKYKDLKAPKDILVGETYFSLFLTQTVTVKYINLKKKEVIVSKGLMSIKCPIDSLRVAHGKNPEKVQVNIHKNSQAKIEYDCRGMRLSEFESLVEFAISDLLSNSVPFINFIHGHGTGTLKKSLRSFIKNHPEIREDSNDNGNDGETKVVLI
jgi:DNA mismatch repair protein MutS2